MLVPGEGSWGVSISSNKGAKKQRQRQPCRSEPICFLSLNCESFPRSVGVKALFLKGSNLCFLSTVDGDPGRSGRSEKIYTRLAIQL